jgi:hypothetical protein
MLIKQWICELFCMCVCVRVCARMCACLRVCVCCIICQRHQHVFRVRFIVTHSVGKLEYATYRLPVFWTYYISNILYFEHIIFRTFHITDLLYVCIFLSMKGVVTSEAMDALRRSLTHVNQNKFVWRLLILVSNMIRLSSFEIFAVL